MTAFLANFSFNRSIKSQVIIFLVTGVSLMTILMGVVTVKAVNEQSRQIMIKNAQQITEGLTKQAVFPILSGSVQNAQGAMDQVLGFQSVVAAFLLDDQGETFSSANKLRNKIPNAYHPQEDEKKLLTQTSTEPYIYRETDDYWYMVAPIIISNEDSYDPESEFELGNVQPSTQLVGYVELIYSKFHLINAQNQVTLIISCVGVLSVMLLSIVLHFGLVRLFKPLNQLASTMQEAETNTDHILADVNGAKEIRKMATIYNSLMQVLDEQDESLKQNRDMLEKEVEIRTKELVTARDAALTANRHKSEFIANISHELRTPIQSIIGYAELVVEELEVEGYFDLIDDMDKIGKNSQRLLSLINNLLDLAKIESGKMDVNYTEVSLQSLLSNIQDTINPLSQKNHNSFAIKNHSELTTLITDNEKLEQVLLNLLSNACKFTENNNIYLHVSSDEKYIVFQVEDNGIGLTLEQQSYIFDEFRQVDSSQSRLFSGTGLGLAISKRFIELLDGLICVESEVNQGATFTVKLPLKQLSLIR